MVHSPGDDKEIEVLYRGMPDAWSTFFHKRRPYPVQIAAIPHILHGDSIFMCAPTASGKTEAAVAPLYQRHISFRRKKLGVLYVAPTKALVNDVYIRLLDYLGGRDGQCGVLRYTGDHHDISVVDNTFILVVTPEALDSLQLTSPEKLSSIKAIIIDEIHLLHGSARGQQLRSVITRIRAGLMPTINQEDHFQIIGMSATISSSDEVANLWTGPNSYCVIVPGSRDIELELVAYPKSLAERGKESEANAVLECLKLLGSRKVLAFANTRNEAHEMAISLQRLLVDTPCTVYLHIGILDGAERDRVEEGLRKSGNSICVATSTLEVGIDIGDIDLVVLLSPPRTVGAYLQRIGRGNRRSGRCRVVGFYKSDDEKIYYNALNYLAKEGILDETFEFERPSVIFQQITSICWAMMRFGKAPKRNDIINILLSDSIKTVLDDMLISGHIRLIGDRLILSDKLVDLGDQRLIHTVITGGLGIPVINARSGETVARMNKSLSNGNYFLDGHEQLMTYNGGNAAYLEPGLESEINNIGKIPSSKRSRLGFSRNLIWEIARQTGFDPREWFFEGNRLICWGGSSYCCLLAIFSHLAGFGGSLVSNENSVSGFLKTLSFDKAKIEELAANSDTISRIDLDMLSVFNQESRFFKYLSVEMQAEECRRALPIRGFLEWIRECHIQQI